MKKNKRIIVPAFANIVVTMLVLLGCSSITYASSVSVECAYVPVIKGKTFNNQLEVFKNCGVIVGNHFRLKKSHLDKVLFSGNEPACVYIAKSSDVYYVTKTGKSLKTYNFDNGCDRFSEGMARVYANGKTAFANTSLKIVLKTGFEKADRFRDGLVEVCNGPFVKKKRGEHTMVSGGRCGLMDRSGKLVVPAKYPMRADIFKSHRIANNGCKVPPVTSKAQAICQANWHARTKGFFELDKNRYRYKVTDKDKTWLIKFQKQADDGFARVIEIEKKTAFVTNMHEVRR